MRQLLVQVPAGSGRAALELARRHDATNIARLAAQTERGEVELLLASVSNARVGDLLEELQRFPGLRVTFEPHGTLALHPPAEHASAQVRDVAPRSPLEIFLSGLQSVGSWKGFVGYALLSGMIAWIGLYTNAVYLLTGAMLIAPFAGPAMNAALATARGDWALLLRSVGRYFVSLAVSVLPAAALTAVFRQEVATAQMLEVSQVSTAAVLLPLAAGAAGALNLSQSERSSLVSGAATGMLVAASLAPPAALIGMAVALGRWEMVTSAVFVIVLQIAGINLAGAVVFRLFGVKAAGPRYARGQRSAVVVSLGLTVASLAALLALQLSGRPQLQRSTRAQQAKATVKQVVDGSQVAHWVEANVRFTRAEVPGPETLLGLIYVQRAQGVTASDAAIEQQLAAAIRNRLRQSGFQATPLVEVTVLSPPP